MKLENLVEQPKLPGRGDVCELEHKAGVRWETVPGRENHTCYVTTEEERIYFAPVRN